LNSLRCRALAQTLLTDRTRSHHVCRFIRLLLLRHRLRGADRGRWREDRRRARRPHASGLDPRRTDTAAEADLHLAILPGTDVALYHAMLNVMLWEELIDRAAIAAHTEGWEALRSLVRDYTSEKAVAICGVAAAASCAIA
jgi:anaerobic selenocysteine-containing dehydrogenase